jgi:hypothetical protein
MMTNGPSPACDSTLGPSMTDDFMRGQHAIADATFQTVCTPTALRRRPPPLVPPPGPLDGVIGLLLSRAAPFDAGTQAALRRQQGWGPDAPVPITATRSHGRWMATPALRRLTESTRPPHSLLLALRVMENIAPCSAGEAAAALMSARLADTPMHPGGVLSLARWYHVQTRLRLVSTGATSTLIGGREPAVTVELHRLMTEIGRAGFAFLLPSPSAPVGKHQRQLDHVLTFDPRLRRLDDLVVLQNDTGSGLSLHIARMLRFAPRPLTVDELYEGLVRQWRFRIQRLPPRATLLAWLAAQSWLDRPDDRVGLAGELTADQISRTDAGGTTALAAIVADGATASWAQLIAALTSKGVKPETAKMAAHTNPVLVHVGPNQYRLRGADA